MENLKIQTIDGKGRGVFANKDFLKDEIVEKCELIIVNFNNVFPPPLKDYIFCWNRMHAIALGYGSLYNHSYTPNMRLEKDVENKLLKFIAIQNIPKEEELTFNYRKGIFFKVL